MDKVQQLQIACNCPVEYPRTILRTKVREHTLATLHDQLRQRRDVLFCKEQEATVHLWELRRLDEGFQSFPVTTFACIKQHLEGTIAQRRSDPRRRFLFIEAPSSRDPLDITFEMFTYAMTYLQVMPVFLEAIFPFGYQQYPRDFHYIGFHADNRISEKHRGLHIEELKRSGRHIELCYSLKSVESTPDIYPWSIRQCSVYYRYDLETEQSVWIVVKGNSLLQDYIKARTKTKPVHAGSSLEEGLDVHSLIAEWASESWQWYISHLEASLQQVTRHLLNVPFTALPQNLPPLPGDEWAPSMHTPTELNPSRRWSLRTVTRTLKRTLTGSTLECDSAAATKTGVPWTINEKPENFTLPAPSENFSLRDLSKVQGIQEKVNELLLVLRSNDSILGRLQDNFHSVAQSPDFPCGLKEDSVGTLTQFHHDIGEARYRLALQESRAGTLLQLVNERRAMLNSILQHDNLQASNSLAEKARISADKMELMTREMHEVARKTSVETVSMRIITLVTLFFLPGTFISTLMSTPIIDFDSNSSGFSSENIGLGALQFFVVVSVPLMCLTFAAWYYVYWRAKRKEQREGVHDGEV